LCGQLPERLKAKFGTYTESIKVKLLKDDLETLVALGLSAAQAKVYLVINKLGKAKASAICKHTDIIRQDLYRILSSLQETGLIEKVITFPTEYSALPVADTVSILLERKRKELTELQNKSEKMLEKRMGYEEKNDLSDSYECKMIPTGEAVGRKINEIFDHTFESVEVLSSVKRLTVSLLKYPYDDLLDKGVKIKVITNLPKEAGYFRRIAPTILANNNFDIRYLTNWPTTVSLCFDMRETLICTDQTAHLEAAPMLWCDFPSIVNLVKQHFKMLWKVALKNDQHALREC